MAKAKISLANGTTVDIEGSTDEIKKLLEFYGGAASHSKVSSAKRTRAKSKNAASGTSAPSVDAGSNKVDLAEIVNLVKSCDEAELIEGNILDKSSQVDRTLLPLYVIYKYLDNQNPLSSGEISRITAQLSVPVATANASRTLSGTASRYVMGDAVRKRGAKVRYKLNRRGVKYMESVVNGTADGE